MNCLFIRSDPSMRTDTMKQSVPKADLSKRQRKRNLGRTSIELKANLTID